MSDEMGDFRPATMADDEIYIGTRKYVTADRIKELEAENRHLRIMLDFYGRLSTHKTSLTELRRASRKAEEYVNTKMRAAQVKGQDDE